MFGYIDKLSAVIFSINYYQSIEEVDKLNDKIEIDDKSIVNKIMIMDNFRYTNSEVPVGLIKCYLKYPTLWYMRLWRRANYFSKKAGLLDKMKMWFYRGLLHHEMIRLQIQIPYNIEMGGGNLHSAYRQSNNCP